MTNGRPLALLLLGEPLERIAPALDEPGQRDRPAAARVLAQVVERQAERRPRRTGLLQGCQ
jgi:hypothetical protein